AERTPVPSRLSGSSSGGYGWAAYRRRYGTPVAGRSTARVGSSPRRRWHCDGCGVHGVQRKGGIVASQGQRFRRRALRRGYKVDEVDSFLDRVEATLNGEVAAPVTAQEVHDVVFRVRFGGYDEWQVDLHLDRVERQLDELEERGGFVPMRGPDRPGAPQLRDDRPLPPVRADRMAP